MKYKIQELAEMAGISARTLRYYDEIEILSPDRINSSGYRIYGETEVDRLQHILFYRELGVELKDIKKILDDPDFNELKALKEHERKLTDKRKHLNSLIDTVGKTIESKERSFIMSDTEKFDGFKKLLIEDNEKRYGSEIRRKYGDEAVEDSNNKLKNMTSKEYGEINELEKSMYEALYTAMETGDPAGKMAQKAADLHRQWLSFYWGSYTKEAHAGVARMYVDDERFTAYYDKKQSGTAKFLRDAILIYTDAGK